MTFEYIYKNYYAYVFTRFARFYPAEVAEEYTQEVFSLVAKRFDKYDPTYPMQTFLKLFIREVQGRTAQWAKAKDRRLYGGDAESLPDDDGETVAYEGAYEDQAFDQSDNRQSALKVINKTTLSPTERQILTLMAYNQPLDAISKAIGRKYAYTKSISNIALKKVSNRGA